MKILHKSLVAAGIATAVFATGAAQAATVSTPSTAAVPAYGKTIVNESVRTVISPVATVVTLGAGEALSVDDSITFTLNNGTFAAIASGDLTAAPNAGPAGFALVSGGAGSNFATYRVTTNPTNAAAVLTLAATATITGTAVADSGAINTTVQMSGFVGGASTSLFGSPLVSLTVQLAPTYTVAFTTGAGIFDVATGFVTLTTSAAAPSVSAAGTITPTVNAAAVANSTTAGIPAGVPTPANLLIALSGPMTGVSAITAANANGSTALGGASTPAVAGGFSIDTANNAAYGTTIATAATPITITFDGTTTYDVSSYSAVVSMTADAGGGYTANPSVATGTTHTFTRNGSAFATNSFGSLNKITITDRSGALGTGGADGAVGISAFAVDGTAVTCTGLTITNVPNNGTVTVEGAAVLAACPGAKRIEGIVNSTSIQTTNTKITADGATSQSGLNGGATITN